MQWLNEFLSGDKSVGWIAILAACGIAVLVALAIVYRLVFAHRLRVPGGRTRQPRLGLVDAFSLDGQRQLVLIRRDNVEHLVMIGGPNDVLVESQINRALAPGREGNGASAQAAAPARRRAEPALVPPPAPAQPAAPLPAQAATSAAVATPHPAAPAPIAPATQVSPVRAQTPPPASVGAPPAPSLPPGALARVLPAAAKASEVAEPVTAVPPQARGVPPRATMPPPITPPITPPSAPAARPGVARPADAYAHTAAPVHPPQSAPKPNAPQPVKLDTLPAQAQVKNGAAVASPSHEAPTKAEPHIAQPAPVKAHFAPPEPTILHPLKPDAHFARAELHGDKPETHSTKPEAHAAAPMPAKPLVFPPPPIRAPTSKPDAGFGPKAEQPAAPAPAPGAEKHTSAGETPPDKAAYKDEDPFADLGSLEAEMARLLGRGTQK